MRLIKLFPIHRNSPRRRWLTKYIRKTPVGWLNIILDHGCPYWMARITHIDNLKTIFNYGPKNPKKKTLKEAARRMVHEKNHKEKLKLYRGMIERGEDLEIVITVVHTKRGLVICDGNHRAIASYLAGKRTLEVEYLDIRWPA